MLTNNLKSKSPEKCIEKLNWYQAMKIQFRISDYLTSHIPQERTLFNTSTLNYMLQITNYIIETDK